MYSRFLLVGLLVSGPGSAPATPAVEAGAALADIDTRAIALLDDEQAAQDWLSHGRTYAEHRYSPLAMINQTNVVRVGLAWEAALNSPRIGIEATPLVAEGVLYTTSSFSRVFAFDAASGIELWRYDPQVSADAQLKGCCKAVNRGIALWKGKVYLATYDGRLIALDGRTGGKIWEVDTVEGGSAYSITQAPIVVDGRVVIGNGGADLGTRGYLSAYDAATGKRLWRFYVVPSGRATSADSPEMAEAASTWPKDHDWSHGGNGNPWNAISYDPQADLVYVGTGNRAAGDGPVLQDAARVGVRHRVGDELYTASILAIHARSGRLAWYYQTTPGDIWDYDACQNLVLADLRIHGKTRKVVMQANKNGFFYVLDRLTGRLISAEKFVRANWASKIDLASGRPVLTASADYTRRPQLIFPSLNGAHNWMGMSFSSRTGLAYIPARDSGFVLSPTGDTWFYNGYDLAKLVKNPQRVLEQTRGELIAWDPVAQRKRWAFRVGTFINSGVLSTAGGVVVYGTQDGHLRFFADDSGKVLKDLFIGTGMVAPPISYAVNGVQYIAVGAGWAGWNAVIPAAGTPDPFDNGGRLIVLKLDGGKVAVASRRPRPPFLPIDTPQPAERVRQGLAVYMNRCAICHGFVGEDAVVPDLRRMSAAAFDAFDAIVGGGALRANGMPGFTTQLGAGDIAALRAFIIDWSQRTRHGLPRRALSELRTVSPASVAH